VDSVDSTGRVRNILVEVLDRKACDGHLDIDRLMVRRGQIVLPNPVFQLLFRTVWMTNHVKPSTVGLPSNNLDAGTVQFFFVAVTC
jgi:hypothetical protein